MIWANGLFPWSSQGGGGGGGGSWGATEQAMLQAVYDAVRAVGIGD